MIKAYTVVEETEMMFDELMNDPMIEAAEALEDEILQQNREWLADPANWDSEVNRENDFLRKKIWWRLYASTTSSTSIQGSASNQARPQELAVVVSTVLSSSSQR